MTKYFTRVLLLLCFASTAIAGMSADSRQVAEVENIYADLNDTFSIIATIDSGLFASYRGQDRAAWERVYREKRKKFSKRLAKLPSHDLSGNDAKAIAAMRKQFATLSETISAPFSPGGKCQDADRKDRCVHSPDHVPSIPERPPSATDCGAADWGGSLGPTAGR